MLSRGIIGIAFSGGAGVALRRAFTTQSLSLDTLNPNVRKMEYAVRGKILIEAMNIHEDMLKNQHKYPFEDVVYANIGDCQAMGQKPLTFVRQLLACCADASLIHSDDYPIDVRERARDILGDVSGQSIGSYSDSRGIELIRKHVEEFITKRDGFKANIDNIYLVNGATEGIRTSISLCLMEEEKTGIMIPIPQYPLYTATIAEYNAHPISYYLDEDNDWSIKIDELQSAYDESTSVCKPRIMVVINPGNPTGQCLNEENMKDIIKFIHKNKLLLMADEVYQENVYAENSRFTSFRKVLLSMGPEYEDAQLISFNSISKGFLGECGVRGGYMEMVGVPSNVLDHVYKLFSAQLCPNTMGQIVVDALVNPPSKGDPSYNQFIEEKENVLNSLKLKATMACDRLNDIPGIRCNTLQGAMYAFPRVDIPEGAWNDTKREDPDMLLDTYYCLELLRQQGICFVPGSGFGQKPGTWHFRTTILPPVPVLDSMLTKLKIFNTKFMEKYN